MFVFFLKCLFFVCSTFFLKNKFEKIKPLIILSCQNPYTLTFLFFKVFKIFGDIHGHSSVRNYFSGYRSYGLIIKFGHTFEALATVFFLNGLEVFKKKISAKILKKNNSFKKLDSLLLNKSEYPLIKFKKKEDSEIYTFLIHNIRKYSSCSVENRTDFTASSLASSEILQFYNRQISEYCFQAIDGEFIFSKRINFKIEKNQKETFKKLKLTNFIKKSSIIEKEILSGNWNYFCSHFLRSRIEIKKKSAKNEFLGIMVDLYSFQKKNFKSPIKSKSFFFLLQTKFSWFVFKHIYFFTELNGIKKKNKF